MKKLLRIPILILLCGMLIFLGGALALALYYRNHFPVNTWINGVYCTGKSLEQVNAELVEQTEIPVLVIEEAGGERWEVDLTAADIGVDYKPALRGYLSENASYLWMSNLKTPVSATLEEFRYSWNREKLEELFYNLAFVRMAQLRAEGVKVQLTEGGYSLYDGNTGCLDTEKAFRYLESCLAEGEFYVKLSRGGCYETVEDTPVDKEQRLLWRQLEELFACNLVYDMGAEQIPLTPDILSGFLSIDGDVISLKQEGIDRWVEQLAAQYDTVETTRDFQTTRGDTVQVTYVEYGTKLDTKAEIKWLTENFWENRQVRMEPVYHIPKYSQEGYARGLDDIGGTYVEVDMTEQHMYCYVDGVLVLDTDVVTGNTGKRMGTPEGINYIYFKQKNRVLRGGDVPTPVKYWMAVIGGVGLHDAYWRSSFGGEIYKTNGSHGCINIPKDVMPEVYELYEVGTPVVMFY